MLVLKRPRLRQNIFNIRINARSSKMGRVGKTDANTLRDRAIQISDTYFVTSSLSMCEIIFCPFPFRGIGQTKFKVQTIMIVKTIFVPDNDKRSFFVIESNRKLPSTICCRVHFFSTNVRQPILAHRTFHLSSILIYLMPKF